MTEPADDVYDWRYDMDVIKAVAGDAFAANVDGGHDGEAVTVRVRVSHDGARVGDVYETVLSGRVGNLIRLGYVERVWPGSGW